MIDNSLKVNFTVFNILGVWLLLAKDLGQSGSVLEWEE